MGRSIQEMCGNVVISRSIGLMGRYIPDSTVVEFANLATQQSWCDQYTMP